MSADHCLIGTFADQLMCIPVDDVFPLEDGKKLSIKSTVTFVNRDEYLQGRVLFLAGTLHFMQLNQSSYTSV